MSTSVSLLTSETPQKENHTIWSLPSGSEDWQFLFSASQSLRPWLKRSLVSVTSLETYGFVSKDVPKLSYLLNYSRRNWKREGNKDIYLNYQQICSINPTPVISNQLLHEVMLSFHNVILIF